MALLKMASEFFSERLRGGLDLKRLRNIGVGDLLRSLQP